MSIPTSSSRVTSPALLPVRQSVVPLPPTDALPGVCLCGLALPVEEHIILSPQELPELADALVAIKVGGE